MLEQQLAKTIQIQIIIISLVVVVVALPCEVANLTHGTRQNAPVAQVCDVAHAPAREALEPIQ